MDNPVSDEDRFGFRRLKKAARAQSTVIDCIHSLSELLMGEKEELSSALDATESAVDADETQDDLDISERDATIAAQKTLIEELQAGKIDVPATIARLQTINSKLHKGGTPPTEETQRRR